MEDLEFTIITKAYLAITFPIIIAFTLFINLSNSIVDSKLIIMNFTLKFIISKVNFAIISIIFIIIIVKVAYSYFVIDFNHFVKYSKEIN